jgi:hypothetical protein
MAADSRKPIGQARERLIRVHFVTDVLTRVAERGIDVALDGLNGRGLPQAGHTRLIPARIELQIANARRGAFALHEPLAPREGDFRILMLC